MPDPTVVRIMREFRDLLEARETDLMGQMATSWLTIERRLDADIALLAREVAERQAAGTIVTQQMLWRMERYHRLHAQMEAEILAWNRTYAIPTIERAQAEFGALGLQSAQQAISASYQAVAGVYFDRLPVSAVETMIGYLGNGAPLNTLLKADYPDALGGLVEALINGIARGFGPGQIAREMANGMGMGLERALLIARTEVNRTYRAAAVQQYRASGVVAGFKRLVKKATACMACLMLDGEFIRVEDELVDHPRGKCVCAPVLKGVKAPEWETGREWFEKLDADQQRAMMGSARYDAWKNGDFGLKDLVGTAHSAEWGDSPRVVSLAELRGD